MPTALVLPEPAFDAGLTELTQHLLNGAVAPYPAVGLERREEKVDCREKAKSAPTGYAGADLNRV